MTEPTHDEREEKKSRLTKTLAVVGLIGILIMVAWLSVQIVTVAPSAFSSLASIADGIYGQSPFQDNEVQVATSEDVIQTGESTTVSWKELSSNGSYIFSYECVDGVSVDISTGPEDGRGVTCATEYDLGQTTTLVLQAFSERERFVDIPFTISYQLSDEDSAAVIASDMVTVVNESISPVVVTEATENSEDAEPTPSGADTSESTAQGTAGSDQEAPANTSNSAQEIVYQPAVSDPNGWTDLAISYKGAGYIENNTFTNTGSLDEDQLGAVQFEVVNLGTKTSNDWTYTAELPGGRSYTSDPEEPLLPGQRQTMSIGFPVPNTDTAEFGITVALGGDLDVSNNDFEWSVAVTD